MAERKTDAQRLEELEKKLAQLKERKKAIEARTVKKERAARTRRLIQIGELSEKYFNCAGIEPSEYETMLQRLIENPQALRFLSPPKPVREI